MCQLKYLFISCVLSTLYRQDVNGVKWFEIGGESLSMTGQRVLTDCEGKEIAGYEKKLFTTHGSSYITIENQGCTMVIAKIKAEILPLLSSAHIYIYDPPVKMTYDKPITTKGVPVAIHAEGDISSKKFDFMMGNPDPLQDRRPYKIAQSVRQWGSIQGNQKYFLEIGPNVDIAFLCMCAYALDEMFCDG